MLEIWVYALIGQPKQQDHGTPYVQVTASERAHSNPKEREALERACLETFKHNYPGRAISCECGWAKQEIKVNPA
jgi:hypothetical protein